MWLINSSENPERLFCLSSCAQHCLAARGKLQAQGCWWLSRRLGSTLQILRSSLGQRATARTRCHPPRAHLVLPMHALDVHHLVAPVLLQDLGLLVCQVAQLFGAALEVVVEAAQALPSPDGGFLLVHMGETESMLGLRSLFPLLLPRTPLALHAHQKIPRDLGKKSAITCSYLMGLPFPLPPAQAGYVCLTRISGVGWCPGQSGLARLCSASHQRCSTA